MTRPHVTVNGTEYVMVEREELERLETLAGGVDLPPLPKPDEEGNYPAVEYARASIARSIIEDRVAAGRTQRELARLAGVRFETICRIETGKNTPSVPTIEKLDRALKKALAKVKKSKRPN